MSEEQASKLIANGFVVLDMLETDKIAETRTAIVTSDGLVETAINRDTGAHMTLAEIVKYENAHSIKSLCGDRLGRIAYPSLLSLPDYSRLREHASELVRDVFRDYAKNIAHNQRVVKTDIQPPGGRKRGGNDDDGEAAGSDHKRSRKEDIDIMPTTAMFCSVPNTITLYSALHNGDSDRKQDDMYLSRGASRSADDPNGNYTHVFQGVLNLMPCDILLWYAPRSQKIQLDAPSAAVGAYQIAAVKPGQLLVYQDTLMHRLDVPEKWSRTAGSTKKSIGLMVGLTWALLEKSEHMTVNHFVPHNCDYEPLKEDIAKGGQLRLSSGQGVPLWPEEWCVLDVHSFKEFMDPIAKVLSPAITRRKLLFDISDSKIATVPQYLNPGIALDEASDSAYSVLMARCTDPTFLRQFTYTPVDRPCWTKKVRKESKYEYNAKPTESVPFHKMGDIRIYGKDGLLKKDATRVWMPKDVRVFDSDKLALSFIKKHARTKANADAILADLPAWKRITRKTGVVAKSDLALFQKADGTIGMAVIHDPFEPGKRTVTVSKLVEMPDRPTPMWASCFPGPESNDPIAPLRKPRAPITNIQYTGKDLFGYTGTVTWYMDSRHVPSNTALEYTSGAARRFIVSSTEYSLQMRCWIGAKKDADKRLLADAVETALTNQLKQVICSSRLKPEYVLRAQVRLDDSPGVTLRRLKKRNKDVGLYLMNDQDFGSYWIARSSF